MLRWIAVIAGVALIGCSQPPPSPITEARRHIDEGQWWDAISACDRVLVAGEHHPEALLLRGTAHLELELPDRAIVDFTKLIEIRPEDAEGYHRRADVHRILGNVEEAYTDRRRARELDVTSKTAYAFDVSTGAPIDLTPGDNSADPADEDAELAQADDEEELESFSSYGAEPEYDGLDGSQELEVFTPGSRRRRQERPRRGIVTTPFGSELPAISIERGTPTAAAGDSGRQDLFQRWTLQRTDPARRTLESPPVAVPDEELAAPDVPLAEEPAGPPKLQITTALPIGLDGKPMLQGNPVGPPNLSLPANTGWNTAPNGAAADPSADRLRNLRRPANASLRAGSFHANPVYPLRRPFGSDPSQPAGGPEKPVISTAIDPNRVPSPSGRVTTGIRSQPAHPE